MGAGRDVLANPVSVAVVEQDPCLVEVLDPEARDQVPTRALDVEPCEERLSRAVQDHRSRLSFGTDAQVALRDRHRLLIRAGTDEDRRPRRGSVDSRLNRREVRLLTLRLVVVDEKDPPVAVRGR